MPSTKTPAARTLDLGALKRKTLIRLQRSLHYSGVARLNRNFSTPTGFLTLMYHSVPDARFEDFVDPTYALPAELFDQQLAHLKANCNVVTLDEAVAYLQGRATLPERATVLTFDDGYLDNLEVAAPLLRKHGLPATLFVATGYIDRQEPQWIDELHCVFRFRRKQVLRVSANPFQFDLSTARGERHAQVSMAVLLLERGYAERRALLDEIKSQLEPSRDPPRLTLGWDDMRTMRREYPAFELGLHSHDHVNLGVLPVDEAAAEVRGSQQSFLREMGYVPRHMSYPYGRTSMELLAQLPALGFDSAFITQATDRITPGTNPWAMSRYEVSRSMVDFRLWSEGAMPGLARRIFGRVVDQV